MSEACVTHSPKGVTRDAKWCTLAGFSLAIEGKLDQAVGFMEEAVKLQPNSDKAHGNLANLLSCQGKYQLAITSYKNALFINAAFVEGYVGVATSLLALQRYEEAASYCRKALQIDPRNHLAHNNLGVCYKSLGRVAEAISAYEDALRYKPQFAEAMNNMGAALARLNKLERAAAVYREAIRLKPDYADAYYNLGLVLTKWQSWDEAVVVLRRAVELRPKHAEASYALGCALMEQGKPRIAGECFRAALALRPDYAKAHYALAYAELLQGNLELGWNEYEWRSRVVEFCPRNSEEAPWDGSPLEGRKIVLYAEQGLGDTVQFVRYAPLVKALGGTVVLECTRSLAPLLQSCAGIDRLIFSDSERPVCDVQARLLSLPRIMRTTLSTIPQDIPYLAAPAARVAKWQSELNRYPGFKVGIGWQGNPRYPKDGRRSIPLVEFAPLAGIQGVRLISLQKGPGSEQVAAVADKFPVIELGSDFDESGAAFLDTAAAMKSLDLVITSDTALAHVAGALGVPVWLALAFVADWRWLQHREDSPWYPSMRIFRQTEPGAWGGVFEVIAKELRRKMQAKPQYGSYGMEVSPGELIDRTTILEIKIEKTSDSATQARLRAEFNALLPVRNLLTGDSHELASLVQDLKTINRLLWDAEDEIRRCERANSFGADFIELARSIYQRNDRRCLIKRKIDYLTGAPACTEKIYNGNFLGSAEGPAEPAVAAYTPLGRLPAQPDN